jgi:DNA-binding NtrC family response regulator
LRDRPSEIEPLAALFLERACTRFGIPERRFSAAALAALYRHAWPGNVRELRNVVERATLLAPSPTIEPDSLGIPAPGADSEPPARRERTTIAMKIDTPSSADAERDRILQALQSCSGNQTRAAELLGVPRRTLVRRIASLRLPRPRRRPPG